MVTPDTDNDRDHAFTVVTGIHGYTDAVLLCARKQGTLIYVADRKTPRLEKTSTIQPLDLEMQARLGFALYEHCPFDHYARKNLGYLLAMRQGAHFILDTDDDNYIEEQHAKILDYSGLYRSVRAEAGPSRQVNVYSHFTPSFIWPRGLPLSAVHNKGVATKVERPDGEVCVWQGLVNGDPDVDAIYRLLHGPEIDIQFDQGLPLVLSCNTYSPFNSQNTLWTRRAFPLMYLPSTVSFRYTDILRSFIAQRCLWAMDCRVGFVGTNARQERNEHNLLKDFKDEVPCHLTVEEVTSLLDGIRLNGDPCHDLGVCYESLLGEGIVQERETLAVSAWLRDVATCVGESRSWA